MRNKNLLVKLIKGLPTKPIRIVNEFLFCVAAACWRLIRPVSLSRLTISEGEKILVLAPHVDDDMLGCGGTIQKYLEAGAFVTIAYLTDGRKSYSETYSEEEIALMRREEARRVAQILGIQSLLFFDNVNLEYKKEPTTVEQMARLLQEEEPSLVFLPFFLDHHVDHFVLNEVFVEACQLLGRELRVLAYEVQFPLTPVLSNRYCDITSCYTRKIGVVAEYTSQTMSFGAILDLNHNQANFVRDGSQAVEFFLETSSKTYAEVFRRCQQAGFLDGHELKPIHDFYRVFPYYWSGLKSRNAVAYVFQQVGKVL